MNRLPATILYLLCAGLGLSGTVQPQSTTLSGFVRASSNRECRSYVNVIVAGTNHDAATNRDGYFVISGVPHDTFTVVAAVDENFYNYFIRDPAKRNTATFIFLGEGDTGAAYGIEGGLGVMGSYRYDAISRWAEVP